MIKVIYLFLVNILTFSFLISGENICDNKDYIYQVPGDVLVIGLIGVHDGENCSTTNQIGIEIMKSLIESVHLIRTQNFLPGIQIGLTIYDTCSQQEIVQKSIVSALVEAECRQAFVLGGLTDAPLENESVNLSRTLNLPITVLPGGNQLLTYKSLIVSETIRLIMNYGANRFTTIDYLIINDYEKELTQNFLKLTSENGICVKRRVNIKENLSIFESKNNVLIMTKFKEMHDFVKNVPSGSNLLLVPLDGVYNPLEDVKAERLMIILPTQIEFTSNFNVSIFENQNEDDVSVFTTAASIASSTTTTTTSFRHMQLLSDLLHFLEHTKKHILEHCKQMTVCQNLPKIGTNYTLPQINSTILNKIVKILNMTMETTIFTLMEQIDKGKLIDMNQFVKESDPQTGEGRNFQPLTDRVANNNSCSNFIVQETKDVEQVLLTNPSIQLRNDSWVAALLSVCTVGITCCIAIAAFIVVRLCKGDMLEGNPGFSFLMLFSMVIMYSAVFPYSFKVIDDHHYYNGVICGIKAIGTSLSYSLVYSIMLSRSVMLASCDEDGGFMSHVNGYLQTVLCFFIAAVQVALTLQFWVVNWLILTKEQCSSMTEGPLFLYLLGYDMFLLLLLLFLSPFIMKSKRNYHEGGYFAVATLLCLLVWICWTIGYILLPSWADLFVCIGLMATASVILISVFIPRTYLMLTGIVRDHIVSTLPHTLSHTTATSVLDVNYRSTQALYDSVNTGGLLPSGGLLQSSGQVNPNYYAERPTTPSTSKIEDRVSSEAGGNLYERYDRSPSPPLNVTRF